MMEAIFQDLRYAFRTLVRNPGFSTVVVLIVAFGIGANAAIFSFVNGVLLSNLPFPEPDRLILLTERNPEKAKSGVVSPRNLEDWERQSKTIENFGAWRDWSFKIETPEGPNFVSAGIASPGLFKALDIKPVAGRLFLPEENQPGRDHVALISYAYWQASFGGDSSIVGQTIRLNREKTESFTVVGILPPTLKSLGLGRFDVWAPVSVDPDQYLERYVRNRRVYARLKPGVSINEAQAEMDVIAKQLAEQYPKDNAGFSITIASLGDAQVRDVRPALLMFLGAVGLVLLIACANVANLLLARASARRKEFAIRAALGAGRACLIRQLLTEAVVFSLVGGAIGVLLAFWIVDLFVAISPGSIPRLDHVKLDGRVVVFALSLSLITGLLFGLSPAIGSSKVNLVEHLKEGQRGSTAGLAARLRALLVISQVALALVLLIGAGLLGKTFVRLVTLQPGFNPENLLTFQLFPPMERYKKGTEVAAFYQRATEEFRSIPGVQSVGATSAGPQFGGNEPVDFLVDGKPAPASGEYPHARYYNIGPDYFRAMQINVLAGREFNDRDTHDAPGVAIINQTMARRHFAGEDPLGRRLLLVRENQALEIVGVVGDVRRFEVDDVVEPEIYYSYMQRPRWASYFAIRTDADPIGIVAAVRSRMLGVDKDVPVLNVTTIDQQISTALRAPRFNTALIGAFAGLALLLASVGLYAVISYSVTQRTHEIGVRMTLGAAPRDIFRLIVGQGMILTLIGVAIGLGASFALTRVMLSMLFEVSATDPLTFAGISVLLTSVSLLACYVPARRAMRVDPMVALRHE
ncbi:MAG TPA: ABC transporter permease [Blastocatellia bacterium]|nr:ABC transporter permease [Blastocatellia bacterium]